VSRSSEKPCSFCGKKSAPLYKGRSTARICRDCLLLLYDIVRSETEPGVREKSKDLGFISADAVERYVKELDDGGPDDAK